MLKIAILGLESHFLFVVFLDPHLIVDIDEIELSKTLSLAKSIS